MWKSERKMSNVIMEMKKAEITIEETNWINTLRENLGKENVLPPHKLNSDHFLLRYIRANKMDLKKTHLMLSKYADEIERTVCPELFTEIYPKDFGNSFRMYLGGLDFVGQPVLMIPRASLWNIKELIEKETDGEEMFLRYCLRGGQTIERELLRTNTAHCTIVVNYEGVAVRNYLHKRTLEVLAKLVQAYETFVPGSIGKIYFVNVSTFALAVVKTVQALMPLSVEIHCFGNNRIKWTEALLKDIPSESLCEELGGNSQDFIVV